MATPPNLDELHGLLVADTQNRFPGDDVSKTSDAWKRTRVTALAVTDAGTSRLQTVEDNLLEDGAVGPAQDRLGGIVDVPRKEATVARTDGQALRVFGDPGSDIADGDLLAHANGNQYAIDGGFSITGQGYFDAEIVSVGTGSGQRLNAGEVLAFASPPAGVATEAILQADMIDGDDVEADGDYQARLLARRRFPGMGGNANDYATWGLEVQGSAGVFVYPLRQGLGTVEIACLHAGQGDERHFTPSEIAEVQAHLDEERPVATGQFRVLETVSEPTSVEIAVDVEDGQENEWDWTDPIGFLEVDAYDVGDHIITFTTDRPSDMRVGDRLCTNTVGTGSYCGGSVMRIIAFDGTDGVVVDLGVDGLEPAPGDLVHAAGPRTADARAAVLAYMNGLGPARGAYAQATQGSWDAVLRTSKIFKLVQTSTGILDSEVIAPTENVEATDDPNLDEVGLIVPELVLVRRRQ
ncbi:MAG: baseplate J/gp47 family protein [Baekduiaceae bacterium]